MAKYCFTSDQRISELPNRIKTVAYQISNGIPVTGKSANNNSTTLRFYYNLQEGTELCTHSIDNPLDAIRNFVLKFQFPNTRTPESFKNSLDERTLFAPFRSVVNVLYLMAASNELKKAEITLYEILFFLFCNESVYQNPSVDYEKVVEKIFYYRKKNIDLQTEVEKVLEWNQYGRQIKELMTVLEYASSCFKLSNGSLRFSMNEDSYQEDKDYIDTILKYNKVWYPSNVNNFELSNLEYISYMDTANTPYSVMEFTPADVKQYECCKEDFQVIYYGAPGTGKSNTIKKIVDEKKKYYRTTFHPDSDYSTFVGCYKPIKVRASQQSILDYDSLVERFKRYISELGNITHASAAIGFNFHDSIVKMQENGSHTIAELLADAHKSGTTYDTTIRSGMLLYEEQYKLGRSNGQISYQFVPQAFTSAYVEAWNTDEDVFLIIEEINRGNCAQIFGDLFQLLDRKNGVSEYPVEADTDLQNYLEKELANTQRSDIPLKVKEGKQLMLPANLYIWATMNTSDQSLFPIDSAFKRRWNWKFIKIKDHRDKNYQIQIGEKQQDWWEFVSKVNDIIASMTSSADKQLGYFFCKAKNGIIDEETFVSKVIFYLWNDVFKDYGFEDTSLFRYIDTDGKERDLTFPDFYNDEDDKVNKVRLADFVQKVMDWKKINEENN